jgi:hypothetical protein
MATLFRSLQHRWLYSAIDVRATRDSLTTVSVQKLLHWQYHCHLRSCDHDVSSRFQMFRFAASVRDRCRRSEHRRCSTAAGHNRLAQASVADAPIRPHRDGAGTRHAARGTRHATGAVRLGRSLVRPAPGLCVVRRSVRRSGAIPSACVVGPRRASSGLVGPRRASSGLACLVGPRVPRRASSGLVGARRGSSGLARLVGPVGPRRASSGVRSVGTQSLRRTILAALRTAYG